MSESFSAFCADLNLPLRNERWSWSALNEERRQALFTVWEDRLDRPARDTIDFSWLNDPTRTENGAREFRRVMARVLDDGFTPYGILCEAVDPKAHPRKRKRFETDLLVLNVALDKGRTIARIVGAIDRDTLKAGRTVVARLERKRSAIEDLDIDVTGIAAPQRVSGLSTFFSRDDKVRRSVVRRASGACEYCGVPGFLKPDGERYIETHHIISLARQGPDTLDNVIALCASDHREAHYGANRLVLEQAFLQKLATLRGKRL